MFIVTHYEEFAVMHSLEIQFQGYTFFMVSKYILKLFRYVYNVNPCVDHVEDGRLTVLTGAFAIIGIQ